MFDYIKPIWDLVYMLQAFQVSRFHPFWHIKFYDPIKSLNFRINGCLKAIYFVQKDPIMGSINDRVISKSL